MSDEEFLSHAQRHVPEKVSHQHRLHGLPPFNRVRLFWQCSSTLLIHIPCSSITIYSNALLLYLHNDDILNKNHQDSTAPKGTEQRCGIEIPTREDPVFAKLFLLFCHFDD